MNKAQGFVEDLEMIVDDNPEWKENRMIIKLTTIKNTITQPILINTLNTTWLTVITNGKTRVNFPMEDDYWDVEETVEEIEELIVNALKDSSGGRIVG